jgi:hypothetical protein
MNNALKTKIKGKIGKWYYIKHPSQSNHDENGKPVRWIAYRYYDERPEITYKDAFEEKIGGTPGWIINTVIRPPVNDKGYPTQEAKLWNDFVEPAELVGYQDEFESLLRTLEIDKYKKAKWSVGGCIRLNRNQAIRHGDVIGENEKEVLVEYTMPHGTVFLNQINKYDDTNIYRAVSRRNPPKKWAQAIAENSEHDIFIPEGRGVVYLRDRSC